MPSRGRTTRAMHGADAGQSLEAAAEEEPQQHRLGLVVEVVGGGDPAGAELLPDPLQEDDSAPAGRRPRGSPPVRFAVPCRAFRKEGHAQPGGKAGGGAGPRRGSRVQAWSR